MVEALFSLKSISVREWGSGQFMVGNNTVGARKSCRVTVQVSSREKQMLAAIASRKGMTVSDFIRQVCIYDRWDKFFAEVNK